MVSFSILFKESTGFKPQLVGQVDKFQPAKNA